MWISFTGWKLLSPLYNDENRSKITGLTKPHCLEKIKCTVPAYVSTHPLAARDISFALIGCNAVDNFRFGFRTLDQKRLDQTL